MCNGALSQGGPMEYKHRQLATQEWTTRRDEKKRRMQLVSSWMSGPLLPRERPVESLEALTRRRRDGRGRARELAADHQVGSARNRWGRSGDDYAGITRPLSFRAAAFPS